MTNILPDDVLTAEQRRTPLEAQIRDLSGGWVSGIRPTGPVLAKDVDRTTTNAEPALFISAVSRQSAFLLAVLSTAWIILLVLFFWWWFQPAHTGTTLGLFLNTTVVSFLMLMPIFFVLNLRKLRRVNPELPLPNLTVAMAVTRAPSEPWPEVRPTLEAMLAQESVLKADIWLCDESPTSEIEAWCLSHGVRISTRHGVADYHQADWPRRTRCKEGNLAYFYDHFGYENYDVVAQFDCDHIPGPGYLDAILRPFADPAVGYVAAPSMCDRNRGTSWSARGRLFAEAMFHGPYQLSHNGGMSPSCIGSHYAVRTEYLRRAGGLGPELAEDFSTSYVIRLTGADGVFAIDAHAHGLGPTTFAAMVTQEFQWTRSLVVLMFGLVRRTSSTFSLRLRLRYFLSLVFNPLFGLVTAAGFLVAPAAVIFNQQWMSMNFLAFLVWFWVVALPLMGMMWVLRRENLLRPNNIALLHWEGAMYQIVRWPYLLQGAAAGISQLLLKKTVNFRVTPKGSSGIEPISMKVMMPQHLLMLFMTSIGVWGVIADRSLGYAGLTLLGSLTYAVVSLVVPWLHFRELGRGTGSFTQRCGAVWGPLLVGIILLILAVLAAALFLITYFGVVQWRI